MFSFPGTETLSLTSDTEVLIVHYDTNAAALAGTSVPVSSSLQWASTIGTSTVENLVVVNGGGYAPDPIHGSVLFTPVAPGGFNRGDCNVDAGFDIADIIHLLDGLFVGGSFSCVSACDYNDDGLVNVGGSDFRPVHSVQRWHSSGSAARFLWSGPDGRRPRLRPLRRL